MTPRPFYYPVMLSIREVAASLNDIVEMAGIDTKQVSTTETLRLMLADYFYGEEAITANPYIELNGRRLVMEHGAQAPQDGVLLNNLLNEVNNIFWLLCDLIGKQALAQTAEYQHRPTDCFYSFHDLEQRVTVYIPVFEQLEQKPNIAPVPVSAVMVTCMRTLPANIRVLMADEPRLNPTNYGVGDY